MAILLLKLMCVVSLRFPSNAVSFFLIDRAEFNYSWFVMERCNKNVLLWAWEWCFGLFVLRGQFSKLSAVSFSVFRVSFFFFMFLFFLFFLFLLGFVLIMSQLCFI